MNIRVFLLNSDRKIHNQSYKEGLHVSKILKVTANDDHTLLIELDNRHKILYDMTKRLQAVRFNVLADLSVFKNISVEYGNTLVWNSLCQISIDEIFNNIRD